MPPTCVTNDVVVRAPFAANSLGIKGSGWHLCREFRDALIVGIEHCRLEVRGESLKVPVGLSPRRKITWSNMFKAQSFLKKNGVNAEAYTLCPREQQHLEQIHE